MPYPSPGLLGGIRRRAGPRVAGPSALELYANAELGTSFGTSPYDPARHGIVENLDHDLTPVGLFSIARDFATGAVHGATAAFGVVSKLSSGAGDLLLEFEHGSVTADPNDTPEWRGRLGAREIEASRAQAQTLVPGTLVDAANAAGYLAAGGPEGRALAAQQGRETLRNTGRAWREHPLESGINTGLAVAGAVDFAAGLHAPIEADGAELAAGTTGAPGPDDLMLGSGPKTGQRYNINGEPTAETLTIRSPDAGERNYEGQPGTGRPADVERWTTGDSG